METTFEREELIEEIALEFGLPEDWVYEITEHLEDEDLAEDSSVMRDTVEEFFNDDQSMIDRLAEELGVSERALQIYCEYHGFTQRDLTPDYFDQNDFEDSYQGEYDDGPSFAEEFITEVYCLEIPDMIESHIDWNSVWDSEFQWDYYEEDGYIFRIV